MVKITRTVLATSLVWLLFAPPVQAQQRSIAERAWFIYATMNLRVAYLKHCAEFNPGQKDKFNAVIQRYRQDTKPLMDKVRTILLASGKAANPATSDAKILAAVEDSVNKSVQTDINFQTARRTQFDQKCDFMADPTGRHSRAPAIWHRSLIGLPEAEYPDDVKAINAWRP
jgi:hypothetical protein